MERKTEKGFTLHELVIAMGLLAIISSLVFSFIAILSKFSKSNGELEESIGNISKIREEVDFWFSIYDQEKYEINILEKGDILVEAIDENENHYQIEIKLNEENERKLIFTYPKSNFKDEIVAISLKGISDISFASIDKVDLEFLIEAKVTNKQYRCYISYS